ncbi:kinesin-like protein KIF23 isoform X1 [Macrosteles quadrilineatus]|uniref:kinesin-like protein KIF23 isoform X1 n=1 Tax=Macrosteles quadrilineatus TaxID=74068 RepID=UPI0023E0F1FD|nr:kinesin-like protein KIF23 isoform X1 [Macrosteles quadrilineatus]XP_054288089.1 kinesin-like protein KIF23 isoform X1 [Macrosteles quadrilineatus]
MPTVKEPIQVYCRLRPLNDNEVPCLKVVSPSTVQMSPPENAVNYQNGYVKETQHTFSYVFDSDASQMTVFNNVALPLVDGVLHGKNGLLFTYGITGSGKTYTMTGTPRESGIMPRALDAIFNSIGHLQAKKCVFKPDRLNGFEVQSDDDAKMDGINEIHSQVLTCKTPRKFHRQESDWANRIAEEVKIEDVHEDNMYAVFVTYIEIYNNSVFDLLDENFEELSRGRGPQSKLVREDGAKNMYVHGVTEVEVKSTDDAFEVFNKGLRRRRMAHNTLNAESSRSHSVFTVRVVQAPLDACGETVMQDKRRISVSQLSFVDLAGSERMNRTNTTGQRLREAGNINNSLMTLRTCLEILRENQANGTNKLVPYRDSKLTHLFKNFFDGECIVRVIVCVNPRSDDYDENIHVMKFSEMSQEVQVVKPTPLRNIDNLPAGRRRANQIFKRAMANLNEVNNENIPIDVGVNAVYSLASQFPDLCLMGPEDDRLLKNLMTFLEVEIARNKKMDVELKAKEKEFRDVLMKSEEELLILTHKSSLLSSEVGTYKEKIANLESQLDKKEVELASLKKQNSGYERVIKRLQEDLHEKDAALNRRLQDREREKQRYQSKIAQTAEKLNQQMDKKLTDHKRKMEMEIKNKDRKLQQVKRILSDEYLNTPTPRSLDTPSAYNIRTPSTTDCITTPSSVTVRKRAAMYNTPAPATHTRTPAVSNPRFRRSRSVGEDRWLEHRPRAPVSLNTVLQPHLPRRRSITRLTDPSDLNNKEKYCLMTQEQDSDGDLETCFYKGDVIPTCSGGAQVILNDVEILKQKSPADSPTRKRSSNYVQENTQEKCIISIEGHAKRSKH